jgi:methylase of polypeptide subunit release factors
VKRNASDHARKTIDLNSVSVTVVQSDLFTALDNTFDLIFFNSVYIPRRIGQTLRIDTLHSYETDWCGGNDGIETIQRFLGDASAHMRVDGKILLGYNPVYVDEDLIIQLGMNAGYAIKGQYKSYYNPSRILILHRGER